MLGLVVAVLLAAVGLLSFLSVVTGCGEVKDAATGSFVAF